MIWNLCIVRRERELLRVLPRPLVHRQRPTAPYKSRVGTTPTVSIGGWAKGTITVMVRLQNTVLGDPSVC